MARQRIDSLSKALSRPELNFDFLLDVKNLHLIRENIRCRKGIGNIDAVHSLWKQIQDYQNKINRCRQEYQSLWDKFYEEAALIPNMCHASVVKGDMSKAKIVRLFGERRNDTNLKTAESIMKAWKALYSPLNACGERSYAFIGPGTDLELALIDYVSSVMEQKGFKSIIVPDVLHHSTPECCGLQQRSDNDILYRLNKYSDFCLSGTSEMGLGSLMAGRIFAHHELPMKLTALSRCFRPEIATTVVESKLYRVHEFNKIEMFVICEENDSDSQLDELVEVQTSIFSSLGLHCRLLDMPSQELGASAARKFDIESWMPGRKFFGEVSSASNCTDFQARRLGIKYYDSKGVEKFAHTCNATAIATTRTIIALIETYQTERKGLVELPLDIRRRMPETRSWTISLRNVKDMNISHASTSKEFKA
ncbi:unnamed protein product [Thelazia callipaeda]|uniref:serine--tRNA ligase n=1 Tax=Thelazia callipaeda TaxID=103827 RepID=A0A0N5CZ32_THECL|nr:unnamed protein product [Thelazia callipaeda]